MDAVALIAAVTERLPEAVVSSHSWRGDATLVLRPEQIKVGAGEDDDTLPLGRIRVIGVTFQGTHRLCHALGGADGTVELLLRLPPEHAVSPSDFLNIYARASDAVLLRH
jgi:hypothetical protein